MASREKWSKRQLERQLDGALFERVALSPPNLSPAVTEINPEADAVFEDSYLIDFLQLSEPYSEANSAFRSVGAISPLTCCSFIAG